MEVSVVADDWKCSKSALSREELWFLAGNAEAFIDD